MLARAAIAGDSSIQVGLDYVVYAEFRAQSWIRLDANSAWLSPVPSATLFPIESATRWVVESERRGYLPIVADQYFLEDLLEGEAAARSSFRALQAQLGDLSSGEGSTLAIAETQRVPKIDPALVIHALAHGWLGLPEVEAAQRWTVENGEDSATLQSVANLLRDSTRPLNLSQWLSDKEMVHARRYWGGVFEGADQIRA